MNEELKVIISAEMSKLKQGIAEAKSQVDGFKQKCADASKDVDDKFKKMGEGMGNAVKAGAKAATAAVATVGTALTGIVTAAVSSYADYEQLVGGVEKLFGDSASTVMKYAQDAYKNAGVSANDYMSQITSFSASLISSLGGDTAAAAEIGNMAINDMSDNANVFGSNITDIQNAYQGFAKQNYTMLDNLKLGYGGTKTEMMRLIDDANKILETMGKTGDLTITEFGDVITAIHLVQEEMKVTGTTAKEAEGTISGSIAMTKSAWENLMIGLADSNADVPQLVQNVLSSATSVISNIIPIVKEVLKSIPVAISEISPEAGAAMQTVMDFVAQAFPILQEAISVAFDVVKEVFTFIKEHQGLLAGVATAIGVVAAAITAYNAVAAVKAAMAAAEVTTLGALIAAYAAQAVAMAAALAPYIAIAAAIAALIAVIVLCVKHWDEIKEAGKKAWEAIKKAWEKAGEWFKGIVDKIKAAFEKIGDWFKNLFSNAWKGIQNAWSGVTNWFSNIWTSIKNVFNSVSSWFGNIFTNAYTGIKNAFSNVANFFSGIWTSIKNIFSNVGQTVASAITNTVKTAINSVLSSAIRIINGFISAINLAISVINAIPGVKISKLNKLNVPQMEKGGIVDAATLAVIGERGKEAVVPLENNLEWLDKLAGMLDARMGGSDSNRPIILQVDGKTFAQLSVDSINQLTRQRGSIPLVIA